VRQSVGVPWLLLNQLVHVILRNMLDGCDDAYRLRAAELFFRPQRLTTYDGLLIAADEETVAGADAQNSSPLVSMLGLPPEAEIDILNDDNAATYWQRSDRFDMAFDLSPGRAGLVALGEVIAGWAKHLLSIETEVAPVLEANEIHLTWYVGLDAEATKIGNALWNGEELDQAAGARIIALFRLVLGDATRVLDTARGEPVYLLLAMTADGVLRMKPQNLITGLPVRQLEGVS
jgi:hypothetical protein